MNTDKNKNIEEPKFDSNNDNPIEKSDNAMNEDISKIKYSRSDKEIPWHKSLYRILKFILPFKAVLIILFVSSIIYAAAAQGRIYFLKPIFDNVFAGTGEITQRFEELQNIILFLLAITLVQGPAGFIRQYFSMWLTGRVMTNVQRKIQQNMMGLDVQFFLNRKQGDIMSRMSNDVSAVLTGVTFLTSEMIVQPFLLVFGVAIALYASLQLAIFMLIFAPILIFILAYLSKRVRFWSRKARESLGDVMSTFAQCFTGIRVIKAFRREKREIERFEQVTEGWFKRSLKAAKFSVFNNSGTDFMYNIMLAVVVFAGGYLVVIGGPFGKITGGDFVVFVGALAASYDPLRRLTRSVNMLQDTFAASERLFEIIDEKPKIEISENAKKLTEFKSEIRFDNVTFNYPGIQNGFAVKNIDFTVKKGTVAAFVGERGAGKSTILDLFLRFYDPDEGAIYIDAQNLRELDPVSLRDFVAVVTQDTFLFNTTIRENISYSRVNATQKELEQAARDANILEFIEEQPLGWETTVGERGARLSGGERQSIAIARAMLAQAPILLLDEATSNLDSVSEKKVQEAINRLITDRTVFVVAHRLSTIRNADIIYVVNDGKIVESGKHDELLALNGFYAKFYTTQFGKVV